MSCNKLQAAFAKRREAEQIKIEQTTAVDKYFDKWDRITSRHEQWTTLNKQADETHRRKQQIKVQTESLENRRRQLHHLLQNESEIYSQELDHLKRPNRSRAISTAVLHNIHDTIKRTEEEKRRLELESRLYKKWRNGFGQDSVMLDAKSDHEALAKMNWLDKQVAMQLEYDREKRDTEQRLLQLQQESRKQAEAFDQRQLQRTCAVSDVSANQSAQLIELKQREADGERLRDTEQRLLQQKKDLAAELTVLEAMAERRRSQIAWPYNVRRIKMILRQRSDAIRRDLRDDIDMLGRIGGCGDIDVVRTTQEHFEQQYNLEVQNQSQIEAMYESEAKQLLPKEEAKWKSDAVARETVLRHLIGERLEAIERILSANLDEQRQIIDIKERHLNALDTLNERYKLLMADQQTDEKQLKLCPSAVLADCPSKERIRSAVDSSGANNNGPPRFGKKKMAWT